MRSCSGLVLLIACQRPALPCACESGHGFALSDEAPCQCVPPAAPLPEATPETTFSVGPGEALDWAAIDAALAGGDVLVSLSGVRDERLDVLRTDDGPHRLVIDGGAERAVVPGVSTTYADVPRHRVTVRRLEVTGSRDKGVYWRAGDDVVLEDLVVHDNRGSPAVMLDYANRTGHASASFTLRSSHIYDQRSECVYIGGSEGEDQDAHARVVVENNLIHDCRRALSSKDDGINIKDRIGEAIVRQNVIFHTGWGLELGSPGTYAENVIFSTRDNGVHFNDQWGEGFAGVTVEDLVVVSPGAAGVRISGDTRPSEGIVLRRALISGAPDAGIVVAAEHRVEATLSDVTVADSAVGFRGWGEPAVAVDGCVVSGNSARADDVMSGATEGCESGEVPDLSVLSGPDGVFFTADDPRR